MCCTMHIYSTSVAQTKVTTNNTCRSAPMSLHVLIANFNPIRVGLQKQSQVKRVKRDKRFKSCGGKQPRPESLKLQLLSAENIQRMERKVGKVEALKLTRFSRCQLLSTFNFSHFQSWGCHTWCRWRKDRNPMKCEIIRNGKLDGLGNYN